MLQVVLSVLMTVGFAVSIALSRTRARGVIIVSALGVILGAYWTVSAWREWRGRGRMSGGRRGA